MWKKMVVKVQRGIYIVPLSFSTPTVYRQDKVQIPGLLLMKAFLTGYKHSFSHDCPAGPSVPATQGQLSHGLLDNPLTLHERAMRRYFPQRQHSEVLVVSPPLKIFWKYPFPLLSPTTVQQSHPGYLNFTQT